MSEQEKKITADTVTEEKMKELFDLMDQKAASGELVEEEEDLRDKQKPQLEKAETPVQTGAEPEKMSESEATAYEYSMMVRQYEALLADYQRREAEEEAAAKAAEGDKECSNS